MSAVCRRYVDFPTHVGAGQDHELPAGSVEVDVVRHERIGESFHDRVAAVGHDELVTVVQVRLGVVADRRGLGESRQDVEHRQGARRVLNAPSLGGHAGPQRFEDLELAREDPLVCAEDFLFVLLEGRSREALAARNRLLAQVVAGGQMQVGLRDFDVVPEDAVESNFQRRDASSRIAPGPPSRR